MLIYKYSEDTKEYLESCEAALDPAEWQINHKKVCLVPANATKTKPI